MNKIFKVIFNHTTQTWVAVSELAKGHCKCKSSSNDTVETPDQSEAKGRAFAGMKTIAITSAMMMAAIVPNAFAVKADAGGKTGSVKWVTGEGTAIAGGDASGDTNAIAIGRNNDKGGEAEARAWAPGAIAIGTGSKVGNSGQDENARGGIALGYNATTLGKRGISIGANSQTKQESATVLGSWSSADGIGASAFSANTTANGEGATAVGFKSNATNAGTTAVGTSSLANGETATAVGGNSNATGKGAVALGANTTTNGAGSTAVGFLSKSTATGGTAIGTNTTAGTGVAIGQNASASNGRTDKASVAVGANAAANGELTTAIGTGATAKSGETVALGANATAGAPWQNHATAIGANSKAVHQGGVALGFYSETEQAGKSTNFTVKNDSGNNITTDNFAGAAKTGDPSDSNDITRVVSVGNGTMKRQIINVAAGRVSAASTDAINGSQLYQAMKHTGFNIQQNGSTKSRINNDGLVNFANGSYTTAEVTDGDNSSSVKMNVVTQNISTDARGVTNVSGNTAGLTTAKTVSDAINNALNNSSFLLKANDDAGEKITRNSSINIAQGKNINVERNGSTITVKTVDNPKFTQVDVEKQLNVATGGSLTVSGTSNLRGNILLGGEGKNITFQSGSTVHMGNNKITNVNNGTAKTDAVNKGQLDDVSKVANAANTTANTANSTANAANTTANAANTTANTANTTANAANTTANTANTTANAANTTANTALNKVNQGWNINTGKAEGGNVEGNSSTNVQMGDTVKVIAGKNLNITQSGKDITLSVNNSPNFTSITTSNGATIGGDLTVNGTTKTKDLNVTNNATVNNLTATNGTITNLNSTNGTITNLNSTNGT
ncbi:ESPR-type extended signal peptide-containing protein, partial [Rodentibacter pneumotropicus]